jgi:hypothetical protein
MNPRRTVFQATTHGLAAGLLGAAATAIVYLVMDVVRGQILFTPAALGSAVFLGATTAADVQVTLATVGGFAGLAIIALLFVGLVTSALAEQAEADPRFAAAFGVLFVAVEVLFFGILLVASNWILDPLTWIATGIANLVSATVIGTYFWRTRPLLRERLRDPAWTLDEDRTTKEMTVGPHHKTTTTVDVRRT